MHDVAACASDVHGAIALSYGDIDTPVYLRSAAKPFIAAAVVASGAAQRFSLTTRELAVMAASHDGEAFHIAAVRAILERIGLGEPALQCGPSDGPSGAGSPVYHNCSGKHAGILAMCVHLDADPAGYLAADHPVQRRILAYCGRLVGEDPASLPLAVDGCGIPVFATTLRRAALAFARMATLQGVDAADRTALRLVRDAMAAEPNYVGGTARFDSALIATTAGRIVGKVGAEGVHGDALRCEGLGLVLKVVDGARRAVPPATIALLRELGALEPHELSELRPFAEPVVCNAAGRTVGGIGSRMADTISGTRTS